MAAPDLTIEEYLARVGQKVGDPYGKYFRGRFKDSRGTSELAMLASPTKEEYEQLARAVAIMTPQEKAAAEKLTDEQVAKIADDARVDRAVFGIFINGFAIEKAKE